MQLIPDGKLTAFTFGLDEFKVIQHTSYHTMPSWHLSALFGLLLPDFCTYFKDRSLLKFNIYPGTFSSVLLKFTPILVQHIWPTADSFAFLASSTNRQELVSLNINAIQRHFAILWPLLFNIRAAYTEERECVEQLFALNRFLLIPGRNWGGTQFAV